MKKVLFLLAMLLPLAAFAQEDAKKLTKFEEFSSKTDSIVKFVDTSLPKLSVQYGGSLETGIRTLKSGTNAYFYRLEKAETSSSNAKIAMVEYSDLVEINKALAVLSAEVDSDVASNPDYLENKFKTVDGFEVGYYVSKGEAQWFLKLERYSRSTVFVKDQSLIIDAFANAQAKIEELKK